MAKKKIVLILLVIMIIVLIRYLKGPEIINNDPDCIYVKINDDKWEQITDAENSNKVIKASHGDTIYISLLENSTILYEWQMQTRILNGLELTGKYKDVKDSCLGSMKIVKDGDNFDRVVFNFKVIEVGDENLSFVYQPKEEARIYDFEKREITLKVQIISK